MNAQQLAEAQAAWGRIQEQGYRAVIRRIANQIWHRTRRPPEESWFGCRTPEAGLWTWEETTVSAELVVDPEFVSLGKGGKITASFESMTITKRRKQIGLTGRPLPMAMCGESMLAK